MNSVDSFFDLNTLPINDTTKLYVSVAGLTQEQNYGTEGTGGPVNYQYRGTGGDVFVKFDFSDLEVIGYYYHASGLGTTALFDGGAYGDGDTRTSYGFLGQVTYKLGPVKLGYNHGYSRLQWANAADEAANPNLVWSNRKDTVGAYYSLTKNLMLLAEASRVKSTANGSLFPSCVASGSSCTSNQATTVNVGAYLGF